MNGDNNTGMGLSFLLRGDFFAAVVGGAIGGLLCFFWPIMVDQQVLPNLEWGYYIHLPFSMVFGSVAAIVFIFVVTGSRLERPRLIAISLLCGMAWEPVLENGRTVLFSGEVSVEQKQEFAKFRRNQ